MIIYRPSCWVNFHCLWYSTKHVKCALNCQHENRQKISGKEIKKKTDRHSQYVCSSTSQMLVASNRLICLWSLFLVHKLQKVVMISVSWKSLWEFFFINNEYWCWGWGFNSLLHCSVQCSTASLEEEHSWRPQYTLSLCTFNIHLFLLLKFAKASKRFYWPWGSDGFACWARTVASVLCVCLQQESHPRVT